MKVNNLLSMFLASVLGGIIAVLAYTQVVGSGSENSSHAISSSNPYHHFASFSSANISEVSFPDLTFAAEKAVHCVVHVTVKSMQEQFTGSGNPLFDFFYGPRQRQQVPREGFGSGVIISADGYIITNNHVIRGSDEIEVTLNDKRAYTAKLIGADPSTDLALLKIEEAGLPFLSFGDSEALRVGEWVLAVGNPFNLGTTVTAGIVSAKARSLGINTTRTQSGVESFIQTDAAVNQGNSGGALVNIRGDLIGINSALYSRTGEFTGNAFAIPAAITKYVIAELKEFGHVQRALLGVVIEPINDKLAKEMGIPIGGVRVETVSGGSAEAGIKVGDVITSINTLPVNSLPDIHEILAKYRPGDQVNVSAIREKKTQQFKVTLRNIEGTTEILRKEASTEILGAIFEGVSAADKQKLGIKSGVRVRDVGQGQLRDIGVRNGFIITTVNDKPVNSASEIQAIVNAVELKGQVLFKGMYPNGQTTLYGYYK